MKKTDLLKKITGIILTLGLTVSALAGCGKADATASDANASSASTTAVSSAAGSSVSTASSAAGKQVFRSLDDIKKDGTINIGVFSDKSPFGYVDENGEYQGYDVYLANRLGKDLGVKVNFVSTEAANRIEYLQTGKVDVILANFTVTDER